MEVEGVRVCLSRIGTSMSFVVVLMVRDSVRRREEYYTPESRGVEHHLSVSFLLLQPPRLPTPNSQLPPFPSPPSIN